MKNNIVKLYILCRFDTTIITLQMWKKNKHMWHAYKSDLLYLNLSKIMGISKSKQKVLYNNKG